MTDPIVERLTRYLASLQYEDLPSGASSTSTPNPHHPATTPLPPRSPVRYRPCMHNARARHDDIHPTVRMNRIAAPLLIPHDDLRSRPQPAGFVSTPRASQSWNRSCNASQQLQIHYQNIRSAATAGLPKHKIRSYGGAREQSPMRSTAGQCQW